MTKYKITITKIEVKQVIKSVYISDEELKGRKLDDTKNYRDVEVTEEVSENLYTQITDGESFNLKNVIDAFNE